MLLKSVRAVALLLTLLLTTTAFAQEEPEPTSRSLELNNLYLVDNQWGSDSEWYPGGLWVLGSRAGQPVVSVNIASADEGMTFEGEITYAEEGPIPFRATQVYANTYEAEVQWGGEDAEWNPDSLWVIGGRLDQAVVSANLSLSEEGELTGEITYAGEGPIVFRGVPVDGGVLYTENLWGSDTEAHAGGVWVFGGRADQQVVSVIAESADEGETLEGEMVYEGEGPIAFRATYLVSNVYVVENQWGGDDAEWNDGGYWLLGGRFEQKIVGINIAAVEDAFTGEITYAGEGPITFNGVELQAWNAAQTAE